MGSTSPNSRSDRSIGSLHPFAPWLLASPIASSKAWGWLPFSASMRERACARSFLSLDYVRMPLLRQDQLVDGIARGLRDPNEDSRSVERNRGTWVVNEPREMLERRSYRSQARNRHRIRVFAASLGNKNVNQKPRTCPKVGGQCFGLTLRAGTRGCVGRRLALAKTPLPLQIW
jgi:hypothetical protein